MAREDFKKDLRRVDRETTQRINKFEYDRLGRYPLEKIVETFGSWDEALKQAEIRVTERNVETGKNWEVSKSRLLSDMRKSARKSDIPFTSKKYDDIGNHSTSTLKSKFGTWDRAYEEADIREIIVDKAEKRAIYLLSKLGIEGDVIDDFRDYLYTYEGLIGEQQILGAFYCSIKHNNQPYSVKEIASIPSGFNEQDIYAGTKDVMQSIGCYISPPPLETFTERYCQELDVCSSVRSKALQMADEVSRGNSHPRTRAAALVYKSAELENGNLTQSEVATKALTSQVTIRNNLEKLEAQFESLNEDSSFDF